jgi:hypothetical protein
MTVTDSDRFAVAMAKLSQARSAVYEATRIIEHLFEANGGDSLVETVRLSPVSECTDLSDPITGLYPGQKPNIGAAEEEPSEEDGVECVE